MKKNKFLLFIALFVIFFKLCLSLNITTDQSSLLVFKSQFDSNPNNLLANNWSLDTPTCTWIGVTCNIRHQRIAALNVSNMNLSGTIPPQIGNLSFLVSLDMSGNNLNGNLPNELAKLKRLKNLRLRGNQLSGSIPESIFNISTLERVDFTSNSLSGGLPANMCRDLSNLKYFSVYSNQLYGSIPSTIGECSQLQTLVLQFNQFTGPVPKQIGNLSMLMNLYLGDNNLNGDIPEEIGKLHNLEYLTLDAIGLRGAFSSFLYNISTLQWLYIGQNNLTGNLPMDICLQLPVLQGLYLGDNQLTGSIPRELGNCSSLVELYMDANMFTGEIPSEIGNLVNLEILVLGTNNLTGHIPETIFNISTMRTLSLRENQLVGSLPPTMGRWLPNLGAILLGQNKLVGPIPDSISNASSLTRLSLVANKLTGPIPSSLGELRFLDFLNLGENDFTTDNSELSFITSLTNCRHLRVIWIQNNSFNGYIPTSIGNLSTSLEQIDASNSGIRGIIPQGIGNLSNLVSMYLDNNDLEGPIPITVRGLRNLQALSIIGNKLNGQIPDEICTLSYLGELTLSKNRIYGPVLACLGNVTSLRYLSLDTNELNSSISPSLGSLKDLLRLNLFSNSLSGEIPQEIGNFKVVTSIDLSWNELTGDIPSVVGGLENLINLSLAHNRLEGPIPDSLGNIISLERLDLSRNNFTGVIPKSMEALQHLSYLNLSFNELTGEIPNGGPFANFDYQSFMSNDALCGGLPKFQVHACNNPNNRHHKLRLMLILLAVASLIFAFTVSYIVIKCRRKNKVPSQVELFPSTIHERISFYDLERATNGFNEDNLLGKGSFGSVYKGNLTDGILVAVKVFNIQNDVAFKSFDTECEVLRNLRHRNLTKVISSCSNLDFRALVLEYMPNGSLENWLYDRTDSLNILQRLDIMIDVASAIEYLHHGYVTPVVHCDLKPSNILIDENMVARVSDFGIAKLVNSEDSVEQTKTLATLGYIAPEYGSEGLVSTKCDVYSFGIVLMETFTKKRPSDDMFAGGLSLRSWINDLYPDFLNELMDETLLVSENESVDKNVDCISLIMKLALDCTAELPGERNNMKVALTNLQKIRNQFFSRHN
ncbi:hypothetical protein ACJIZ3_006172 [Penstemon smallii]|uniref:non-specific serine/threonine protein kinase n=1 Tax=Penstemon smallii TaxID=265156 RepID=A0ABD3S7A8_9LAMI